MKVELLTGRAELRALLVFQGFTGVMSLVLVLAVMPLKADG